MKRRLLNSLALTSLLMSVATLIAWTQSYPYGRAWQRQAGPHTDEVELTRGTLFVRRFSCTFNLTGLRDDHWVRSELRRNTRVPEFSADLAFQRSVPGTNASGFGASRLYYMQAMETDQSRTVYIQQASLPLWLLAVVTLAVPLARLSGCLHARVRSVHGLCIKCGYSLIGNTSGICPECGTPVAANVEQEG